MKNQYQMTACVNCGKFIKGGNARSRYCCNACRQQIYRTVRRIRRSAENTANTLSDLKWAANKGLMNDALDLIDAITMDVLDIQAWRGSLPETEPSRDKAAPQ